MMTIFYKAQYTTGLENNARRAKLYAYAAPNALCTAGFAIRLPALDALPRPDAYGFICDVIYYILNCEVCAQIPGSPKFDVATLFPLPKPRAFIAIDTATGEVLREGGYTAIDAALKLPGSALVIDMRTGESCHIQARKSGAKFLHWHEPDARVTRAALERVCEQRLRETERDSEWLRREYGGLAIVGGKQ